MDNPQAGICRHL